jgi:hypothetical protein
MPASTDCGSINFQIKYGTSVRNSVVTACEVSHPRNALRGVWGPVWYRIIQGYLLAAQFLNASRIRVGPDVRPDTNHSNDCPISDTHSVTRCKSLLLIGRLRRIILLIFLRFVGPLKA